MGRGAWGVGHGAESRVLGTNDLNRDPGGVK